MSEDVSIGELARGLAALTDQVRELVKELRDLPEKYVPRGEYELQFGGVKVDIGRIDRMLEQQASDMRGAVTGAAASLAAVEREIHERITASEERRVSGTRWAIGLAVTALLAVLSIAVTVGLALSRLLP